MRQNPHHTNTDDHLYARKLRRQSSPCEQKLWFALRQATADRKIKFRRQQPIHPYIADFACMKAKLLIELDGFSHDGQAHYDQARDSYLKNQGYEVLRISNNEVLTNIQNVVEAIVTRAEELLSRSNPLTSKN
jgi:very-short-patch-repair endonuclease